MLEYSLVFFFFFFERSTKNNGHKVNSEKKLKEA